MTTTGNRLRAFAARWCSDQTTTRVIEPLVADMQAEVHDALANGRIWRSRWVRLAGYSTFLKVIVLCGATRVARGMRDWPAGDRVALIRTVGIASLVLTASTALLMTNVLRYLAAGRQDLLLYLIPQAITVALPTALTCGIICGLGGRVVSRRLRSCVLAIALGCFFVSFAAMGWIIPTANQAFRVAVSGQADMSRGLSEMTRGELSQRLASAEETGSSTSSVRRLDWTYQQRLALPCAAVALALVAVGAAPRRPRRAWVLWAAAYGVCAGYYLLFALAQIAGKQGSLPIFLAAWLPNLACGVVAVALTMIRARPPATAVP
jgi:lipopolysaccharide export LptBFGC system permease protein LptF